MTVATDTFVDFVDHLTEALDDPRITEASGEEWAARLHFSRYHFDRMISSVAGKNGNPLTGAYAASKHALEGYSESLDHEVRALGIRAVLVEPGFMKTKIDKNATLAARTIDDYAEARERVGASINASIESGGDPALVARAITAALSAPRPKLRYPVGKGAGTLATLRSFMPAALFDRSLRKEFRLDGAR